MECLIRAYDLSLWYSLLSLEAVIFLSVFLMLLPSLIIGGGVILIQRVRGCGIIWSVKFYETAYVN